MNIFAFDPDPRQSAMWLDDVRQNKMILETAQLLSTAIHKYQDVVTDPIYRPTHKHHPCTKWVVESKGNYEWTVKYLEELGNLRNPTHKSLSLLSYFKKFIKTNKFYKEDQTPFANCARNMSQGLDFTGVEDTHKAYQLYINKRWDHDTIKLSWNHGQEPEWRTQ